MDVPRRGNRWRLARETGLGNTDFGACGALPFDEGSGVTYGLVKLSSTKGSAMAYIRVLPRHQRRRGIAATELAVLAPFLVTVVLGMFEVGRCVMVKDLLTNAARKGCRTGTTASGTYQNILDDVNNILSDNNIPASDATITVQVATYNGNSTTPSWGSFATVSDASSYTPNALDKVSVKVAIPVTDVLWFAPAFISSASLESETLTMVRQK
jgi:Flp pilus assembly protein TadG